MICMHIHHVVYMYVHICIYMYGANIPINETKGVIDNGKSFILHPTPLHKDVHGL